MIACVACDGSVASDGRTLLTCPQCGVQFLAPAAASVTLFSRVGDGGVAEPPAEVLLSPEFRQRYELGRLLGAGGMGCVYLARERAGERTVAVKLMLREADGESLARFLREGQLMARVDHPNVVRVIEAARLGQHPYLVTEFVDGGTLADRLRERGRLPPAAAVDVACGMLAGLQACHEQGIVHRDLKPANVLLAGEQPKLADLGIARDYAVNENLTGTGVLIGTPRYMSPEQIRGERAGVASDLYQTAIILYELLSGRTPFIRTGFADIIHDTLESPPPPIREYVREVPEGVARALHAALAKRPSDRPPTARDLETMLRSGVAGKPRPVQAAAPLVQTAEHVRALPPAAIPLVIAGVLAAGMIWMAGRLPAPKAAAPAAASASPAERPADWTIGIEPERIVQQISVSEKGSRVGVLTRPFENYQQELFVEDRQHTRFSIEKTESNGIYGFAVSRWSSLAIVHHDDLTYRSIEDDRMHKRVRYDFPYKKTPTPVVCSPYSDFIATPSGFAIIRLWESVHLERTRQLVGRGLDEGLQFSENQKLLATWKGHDVEVFDVESAKVARRARAESDPVLSVSVDGDTREIVVATAHSLELVPEGRAAPVRQSSKEAWVAATAPSVDGLIAATAVGSAITVRLLKGAHAPVTLDAGPGPVKLMQFSPDGRALAWSSGARGAPVLVWFVRMP